MMRRTFALVVLGGLLGGLPPVPADARVVRIEVERTAPYAGGKAFGDAGAFERLDGTVHMEVDPDDPLNAVIVNLDRAPRNDRGMVEFSAPFFIVKPVDMARGNRKLLYGINNRGNAIELPFQTFPSLAPGADPESGDGLFFRLGYTFVDAGWAGDVTTTAARLGANLPVAVQADGSPIVSRIRIEYPSDPTTAGAVTHSLPLKGNDRFVSYETADTDTTHSTLTVRDAIDGAAPAGRGRRLGVRHVSVGPGVARPLDHRHLPLRRVRPRQGVRADLPGEEPVGHGPRLRRHPGRRLVPAPRDGRRRREPESAGRERRCATGIRRAYGLGISSTGMYLRDWLYLGFNEDEAHRRVFDAVRIHIPGTHRLFANVEFADPNIYSRQDRTTDFTSQSYPPLTYAVTTDPVTGVRDGILKRPATDPLVFHVDTSNEFWQMKASLNVHDGHGNAVPIPDNVRLYLLASHPHGGPPASAGCRPSAGRAST